MLMIFKMCYLSVLQYKNYVGLTDMLSTHVVWRLDLFEHDKHVPQSPFQKQCSWSVLALKRTVVAGDCQIAYKITGNSTMLSIWWILAKPELHK